VADDARTEARLWFIQALVDHRPVGARCKCGVGPFDDGNHDLHVADALLSMFPDISVENTTQMPGPGTYAQTDRRVRYGSRLVLRGPVEPVTEESPKVGRCPGCDAADGERHDDGCHGAEWGQYAWPVTEEREP